MMNFYSKCSVLEFHRAYPSRFGTKAFKNNFITRAPVLHKARISVDICGFAEMGKLSRFC